MKLSELKPAPYNPRKITPEALKGAEQMKNLQLKTIAKESLVTLARNPQHLTPKQMDSLKRSIERDGFLVPLAVRHYKKNIYEIISGNHRFMAGSEIGMTEFPCIVSLADSKAAKRIAVNLNTIHGEPNAELMAPFLAELDDITLSEIHLEGDFLAEVIVFDEELKERLSVLQIPDELDNASPQSKNKICTCSKCGRKHFAV